MTLAVRTRSHYVADQLIRIEKSLSEGDWSSARDAAQQAANAAPNDPHVLHASGRLCELAEMTPEALEQWVHAVTIDPTLAVSWSAIGTLLSRGERIQNQHVVALLAFAQATRADPEWLLPHWHLALMYHALGHHGAAQAAVELCAKVLEVAGNHPKNVGATNIHNRAYMHLTLAQWELGFACYEARLEDVGHTLGDRARERPPAGVKRWTAGMDVPKSVAIFTEQGAGDMLMTLRYAWELHMQGTQVVLEVSDAMMPYVQERLQCTNEPGGIILIAQDEPVLEPIDAYVWAMSLPGLMGVEIPVPPRPTPREGAKQYVGFAWQGSRAHKADRIRSCPVEVWRPVAEAVLAMGYTPIALNPGEDIPHWLENPGPISTFAETAKLLTRCVAVVSVDTALVHLAGNELVPTFAALSALPDWRWGLRGDDTIWYPTVNLVRQPVIGDWTRVAESITSDLTTFLSLG